MSTTNNLRSTIEKDISLSRPSLLTRLSFQQPQVAGELSCDDDDDDSTVNRPKSPGIIKVSSNRREIFRSYSKKLSSKSSSFFRSSRSIGSEVGAKPKLLFIHGWRSNNEISKIQSDNLGLEALFDVTYLIGPIKSDSPADETVGAISGPYFSWIEKTSSNLQQQLIQSLDIIINELNKKSYAVVFGFSQGAALASLLSTDLMRDRVPSSIRLIICACARGYQYLSIAEGVFNKKMTASIIPSCHLIGVHDPLKADSEKIMMNTSATAHSYCIYFDGGHEMSIQSVLQANLQVELYEVVRSELQLTVTIATAEGNDMSSLSVVRTSSHYNDLAAFVKNIPAEEDIPMHVVSAEVQLDVCSMDESNKSLFSILSQQNPSSAAIHTTDGLSLTFGDLTKFIQNQGSLSKLGLTSSDIVAYLCPYGPIGAVAFLTFASQCTAAPLDPAMSKEAILQAIIQLNATALIVLPGIALVESYAEVDALGVSVYFAEAIENSCGLFSLKTDKSKMNSDEFLVASPQSVMLLLRTSGTTSMPKVVPLRHGAVTKNALILAKNIGLTCNDVCLNAMPLFHIGGISANLLGSLATGGSVICSSAFSPLLFTTILSSDKIRPTWYSAVPTMHASVTHFIEDTYPTVSDFKHSIRMIRSGAATLPHDLAVKMESVFKCLVIPTYSMTEQMPISHPSKGFSLIAKAGSVGKPLGASVCIVDNNLRLVPYGSDGEICISGDTVFDGYANDPIANQNSFFFVNRVRFFRTGDVGRMDKDGYIFINGRSRELIKRGGEQVSPHEVEDACYATGNIKVAVAFAVPSAFWGQEVGVAVVFNHGSSNQDLSTFSADLRQHYSTNGIAFYKFPEYIEIVNEMDLPKTTTNKYIRVGLAEKLGIKSNDNNIATIQKVKPERISEALQGVKFAFSFWIMFNHIGGVDDSQTGSDGGGGFGWFAQARGFCSQAPGFFIMGGFFLAATTYVPVLQSKFNFYQSRLVALFPMYYVSLIACIANFLNYCRPEFYDPAFVVGKDSICMSTPFTMSWGVTFTVSVFVYLTGIQAWFFVLPFTWFLSYYSWFSSVYYFQVVIFPWIHNSFYQVRNDTGALWKLIGLWTIANCLVIMVFSFYFRILLDNVRMANYFSLACYLFPPFWTPLFALGVGSYFLFAKYRPNEHHSKWIWGYVVDFLSCIYLVICFLYTYRFYLLAPDTVVTAMDQRYWNGITSRIKGFMDVIWLFGLAVGEGYTARFWSHPFFVKYLAPASYNCYIFHQVIGQWYYLATRGIWWAQTRQYYWFSPVPVPVQVYEFFIIVALTVLLSYLLEEYVSSWLVLKSATFLKYIFGSSITDTSNDTTVQVVIKAMNAVVGTSDASPESNLLESGLSSLTSVVLVSEIKATFKTIPLNVRDVYNVNTAQELANLIDERLVNTRGRLL